jgi:molecular chaperone DnaK (HSP70)
MIGIDLGTTNSVAYKWENGDAKALCDLVPSVVDYTAQWVGKKAKKNIVLKPENRIASSFKVDIDLDYAVEASSRILSELKLFSIGDPNVVVTVPAYFSANQRAQTVRAAEKAGLKVGGVLNEPTAAALYYNRTKKDITMVYDLGGGTFDISIIDTRFGRYDVCATDGLKLGGDDLDNMLVNALMNQCVFKQQSVQFDEVRGRIKEVAEACKIRIQKEQDDVLVELKDYGLAAYFGNDKFKLDVHTYKMAVKRTFGRTINKAKKVMMDSGYASSDLSFIFVGGSTRDPYLRDMVEMELGIKSKPFTYDPDKIVAQGAAYFAHLLETGDAADSVSDVTTALGLLLNDGTIYNVIAKNSILPLRATHVVRNATDSEGVSLSVYQGDSVVESECVYLGQLDFKFLAGMTPANLGIVTVYFDINTSGLLTVSAKELGGDLQSMELTI